MTFDEGCKYVNARLAYLAEWKHNYFGAAYSTRLTQLSADLRDLANKVDQIVAEDDTRGKEALARMGIKIA